MSKKPRGKPLPLNDPTPKTETSKDTAKAFDDDAMTEIMERADEAYRKERDNIEAAYEDLQFLAGEGHQWTEEAKRRRRNRPMFEVNQMPKFVRQVTGDFRQSVQAVKIVPADGRATPAIADLMGGMIRYIENRSEARAAANIAGDQMAGCGIGHMRIMREFAEETTCNTELRVMHVEDGVSVLWDTDAVLPTREDAEWCFVPVDMSERKFKRKYPDVPMSDFNSYDQRFTSFWLPSGHVRVAEYWEKRKSKRVLAMHTDGAVEDLTDDDGAAKAAAKAKGARIVKRDGFEVWRSLVTLGNVLEPAERWPGRYIPIIPLIGEEVRVGRKVIRRGVVRLMKDSQRRYNYNISQQAEVMSLAPKAPWLVTEKNVEDNPDDWAEANQENAPYLTYKPDPLNGGREPSRVAPAMNSAGLQADTTLCMQEMQEVTGIYRSALGGNSNETSGVAIERRDAQTDTGNSVYLDNFSMSKRHAARIMVDLIPSTYDTERIVMILDEKMEAHTATVNKALVSGNVGEEPEEPVDLENDDTSGGEDDGAQAAEDDTDESDSPADAIESEPTEAGDDDEDGVDQDPDGTASDDQSPKRDPDARYLNDLTIGSYEVVFENGPSFKTKQDEAGAGMSDMLKSAPTVAPLILDLYAKQQNWPYAGEIAKRLEMMLPPPIQEMLAKERAEEEMRRHPQGPPGAPPMQPGMPGQPGGAPQGPPPPPQPSPVEMAQMQAEMAKTQAEVAKAQSAASVAELGVEVKQIELAIAKLELGAKMGQPGDSVTKGLVEEIAHLHGMVAEIVAAMHGGAPPPEEDAEPSPDVGQVGRPIGQPLDGAAPMQRGAPAGAQPQPDGAEPPGPPDAEPPASDRVAEALRELSARIEQMHAATTAPRTLIKDEKGAIVGVKHGKSTLNVVRDAKGEISGVEHAAH